MSISFNQVPSNGRVPFTYVEFDSSKSQGNAALQPYSALILGVKATGAGTATADTLYNNITSEAQAITLFGRGSMLHRMVKKFLKGNKFTKLFVIPQAEAAAGAKAAGTLTVTGPATAAGTLFIYIAGDQVQVGVSSGDSANTIATNIQAALALALDLPIVATVTTNVVTLTAMHKGALGNGIDVRVNYQDSDALPAGVAIAVAAMTGGTAAPSLTATIAAMGETQFNVIVNPYTDATSLTAIEAEMLDRWGPVRQNDGVVFSAMFDTVSNLGTFGTGRNSKHVSMMGFKGCPSVPGEVAAAIGAAVALYGNNDPARPFQTLPLVGILAPKPSERMTMAERNTVLYDGIATANVDAGGNVLIDRLITMYQLNGAGAPDVAFLDVNTLLTLSYLRYDFRNMMMTKYPRSKLASDGTRYGAGQAIITPLIGKAECIAKFRQWEELGLVEDFAQFKRDLIVERNAQNVNRLDFYLPPNLVNQLMINGVQIGFIL